MSHLVLIALLRLTHVAVKLLDHISAIIVAQASGMSCLKRCQHFSTDVSIAGSLLHFQHPCPHSSCSLHDAWQEGLIALQDVEDLDRQLRLMSDAQSALATANGMRQLTITDKSRASSKISPHTIARKVSHIKTFRKKGKCSGGIR